MKKLFTIAFCLLFAFSSADAGKGPKRPKGGKKGGKIEKVEKVKRERERMERQTPRGKTEREGMRDELRDGGKPKTPGITDNKIFEGGKKSPSGQKILSEGKGHSEGKDKQKQANGPSLNRTGRARITMKDTGNEIGMQGAKDLVGDLEKDGLSLEKLQEKQAQLLAEHERLDAEQVSLAFNADLGKSVVFAPIENGKKGGFTVTIIKTEYEGSEEVFGVIATHVLPSDTLYAASSLQRSFHVQVPKADGTYITIPAEVVQISPQSMLDISLVKFPKEVEELLSPLELADTPAAINEILFSYGFADTAPSRFRRTVTNNSFMGPRTDMSLTGLRYGYCGSPLLDALGKVKAIHTGTKEGKNGELVSYGTHVTHIRTLIDAYHNNGVKDYELTVNEHAIGKLAADEYISSIYLYDASGKRILTKNFEDKFSESFVVKALEEHPDAAYLQFTTRKALWVDEGNYPILKENRTRSDKTKEQHWYNIETQQIELQRPSVVKN